LNPLHYYEEKCELFANLKDLQNVIRNKSCRHHIDTIRTRHVADKKGVKQQWQRTTENLFTTFSADQLTTVTFWCRLHTSGNLNYKPLANIAYDM